jgi:hypothetical protein
MSRTTAHLLRGPCLAPQPSVRRPVAAPRSPRQGPSYTDFFVHRVGSTERAHTAARLPRIVLCSAPRAGHTKVSMRPREGLAPALIQAYRWPHSDVRSVHQHETRLELQQAPGASAGKATRPELSPYRRNHRKGPSPFRWRATPKRCASHPSSPTAAASGAYARRAGGVCRADGWVEQPVSVGSRIGMCRPGLPYSRRP